MAAPISAAVQDKFTQTAEFICAELVTSEVTELYTLQVSALRQHAAAAFLDTFPCVTRSAVVSVPARSVTWATRGWNEPTGSWKTPTRLAPSR